MVLEKNAKDASGLYSGQTYEARAVLMRKCNNRKFNEDITKQV